MSFVKNPDILATIAKAPNRPRLVIGFAAETENVVANARAKVTQKNADWILANDVSGGAVFGEDSNTVTLVSASSTDPWPKLSKDQVAARLVERIVEALA